MLKSENGFTRATFFTPKGTLTVILPDDLCQGDSITGSIFATDKEFNFDTLNIDIGSAHGAIPESGNTKRTWTIPKSDEARLGITAWSTDGTSYGTTYLPISSSKPKPDSFLVPSFVRIGAPFVITGPFDGDTANTSVKNGTQNFPIVAESPRKAIALVPSLCLPGSQSLDVTESGFSAKADVSLLLVNMSASKTNLNKGDRAELTISCEGIQDLAEAQAPMIIVENLTPKIVDLEGKVKHFLIAKPSKDGDFTKSFIVTSLTTGSFTVALTVDPGKGTSLKKN